MQNTMKNFNRRRFMSTSATAVAAAGMARQVSAEEELEHMPWSFPAGKAEHIIMFWLGGGACHIDTWDPKKMGDAKTRKAGSYYPAIDTVLPNIQVCEHLPRCARILDRFNILRSVQHGVINEHAAATNIMHTGRMTTGTITYPSVGSAVTYHLGAVSKNTPPYILIGYPNVTRGPGFLGAKGGFVYLTETSEGPGGFSRARDVSDRRQQRRQQLLAKVRQEFSTQQNSEVIQRYDQTIEQALKLAGPEFMSAFELKKEPASLRNSYGGEFGQRCLLARRLVERGTRFVEVSHNLNFINGSGWDTHNDGQLNQHLLIKELDSALSTLVLDLEEKSMLDKTLIVVATEFGRPAGFDGGGGRGHHSKGFSIVLAGGGLQNGRTIGATDELGMKVIDRPISVPDLHASMYYALGINPRKLLYAGDRPVPTTDMGTPVEELFV
ncbi:MAG: hypothetical protein CMJ76_07670 [Planctomycetaceae bacterium]|nr:hypothetical protein [Planctomycetaceae bacterium]|tara:strand:+ start:3080 stop:4396 length:1317 start_codon:yes stop_codon:yes gene_type:complete